MAADDGRSSNADLAGGGGLDGVAALRYEHNIVPGAAAAAPGNRTDRPPTPTPVPQAGRAARR